MPLIIIIINTASSTRARAHLTALCPGLDFTEARDSEWQWRQLGRMQVCTSLQTDNHASTPPLIFYRPDALPAAQPTASKHLGSKAHLPPHRWTTLPRLRTKFGERAFSHAGPATWNHIRTVADPVTFRKLLKSHCFSQAFNT